MSNVSKRTIAGMVTGVMVYAAYIFYALGAYSEKMVEIKDFCITLLIFIGAGIVVMVLVQIAFYIALAIGTAVKNPERSEKYIERLVESEASEDEMDKLIQWKAERKGYIFAGLGILSLLISLALGASLFFSLHLLFALIGVGGLVEGGVMIYHYERGVRNG